MPLAYSYLRFSSPQQAAGDSIRRQTEATAEWCARHKVALDQSLNLRDEGVSAFRGKHRQNPDVHGLAAFLAAVKAGRVPEGSFLIVENLDRLTREAIVPAVNLFTGILLTGVKIVQLKPAEQVFHQDADMTAVMLALVELSRGNSESRMKSERVGAAWANMRKQAGTRVLTRKTPGWIKCEGEKLVLDREKAKIVRRMFEMAREGKGVSAIAQTLNAEEVPVFGRREYKGRPVVWSKTVIYHILTSRTTVGELQFSTGRGPERRPAGEPVKGYYPAVVSEDDWHAAQGMMKLRATVGRGRRGKHVNLFAGLLIDARDGGSISYSHCRRRPPSLVPVGALHGRGTVWTAFPAVPFEQAILAELVEVKASDVAGRSDMGRKVETLTGKLAEVETLKAKWQTKMDNPDLVDTVAVKLADLNARGKAIAEELAAARREAASPISKAWGEFRTLADLLAKNESDDLREQVRAALRRAIESVHCLFLGSDKHLRVAAVRVQFRGGDRHRDYLVVYTPGHSNARVKRNGNWFVRSFTGAGVGEGLDLRNPKDANSLERDLLRTLPAIVEKQSKASDSREVASR